MTDNNTNTELNFEDDPILNEEVENAASQIDNTQTAVDAMDNTSIDERENVLYLTKIIPELILNLYPDGERNLYPQEIAAATKTIIFFFFSNSSSSSSSIRSSIRLARLPSIINLKII